MTTITTRLATASLAALALGAVAPATATAAPTISPGASGAADGPSTQATPAPSVAQIVRHSDTQFAVSGLAHGATHVSLEVAGGGGGLAPGALDRVSVLLGTEHLGKEATLTAYGPTGPSESVPVTLELHGDDGGAVAPNTPQVHAVSTYDGDDLVIEGTVTYDPRVFDRTTVHASVGGTPIYDSPDENGAFSLTVPASYAGQTVDVQAFRSGLPSGVTPVELVETEANTASEAFPLAVESPAPGGDPGPAGATEFVGSGIPDSKVVVTRDGETRRESSTLCETRVAASGDWSCTSAQLPAGTYGATVTETPTWRSAPEQKTSTSFTVAADEPDLLPSERPVTPTVWSIGENRNGDLVVRVIAHNAGSARLEVGGTPVVVRGVHGRFSFTLDADLAGEKATVTGLRGDVESPSLEVPLTTVEAPAASPLTAPKVHGIVQPVPGGEFVLAVTTDYFADEYAVPFSVAMVDGRYAGSAVTTWNGAQYLRIGAEHAGKEVAVRTTVGDGALSEPTTVVVEPTGGNTAPVTFPLDVVSPAEGAVIPADTEVFTGEGIPGSRITLTADADGPAPHSAPLGVADVLGDGTWTAEIDGTLAAGAHTVSVTETPYWKELAPLVSTRSFTVTDDDGETPAPAAPVTISTPADVSTGYARDTSFTFEGTAEPRSELTVTNAKGLSLGDPVDVAEDGTWSWTRTNMGSYSWTIDFTTDAGTDRQQQTRLTGFEPRVVGTTPVTIATPADVSTGYAPDTSFTFTGTARAGAEISVTNAKGLSLGAPVTADADGDWSWTRTNMGSYAWTMIFTADAGTDLQQRATLTEFAPRASSVAPVVVTNPADVSTGYARDTSFTFEGTAEPLSELTVTNAKGLSLGDPVEVAKDGTWSWTRTNMGSYSWTMVFTTDAGTDRQQQARLTGFEPRS
jgi:hypothetical protein